MPNTLDSEPFAPQRDVLDRSNHVHHNNSTTVDAKEYGYVPFGMGIVVAGGREDRIIGNLVEDQATYGIATIPIVDTNFWPSSGNEVRGNVVRRSGRADMALAAPSAGADCFGGNDAATSHPASVELLFPCSGSGLPGRRRDMGPTANVLSRFIDSLDGEFPHGDWRTQPTRRWTSRTCRRSGSRPSRSGDPGGGRSGPLSDPRRGGHPRGPCIRISQEVSLMGVPLIASSWWSLLLGLYGYILLFVLYAVGGDRDVGPDQA